jgi:hypothetical protein
MKTKSIFFSVFFTTFAFASLTNCSGNKKEDAGTRPHDNKGPSGSAVEETPSPQFQVDEKFQEQLSTVFTSYVELKDAFVDSDVKKVQSEASETNNALAKVDMKLVSGAAHNDWMNYLIPMQNSLKEIHSGADIEAQRKSFSTLSDNLYKSVKAFGLGGKEAFYEYCSMAFNNEGGYWLSDQEQIRNPYFGDKMLTCGEVKEKLK